MKKLCSLLLALALALTLSACAPAAEAPAAPAETGVSVTDMTGRAVELDAPAQRVVVLGAADAEILYAVGAGAAVVGRGAYCDYPAELADVTAVGSGAETNVEELLALEPDVVIMTKMDQTVEQVAAVEEAGVPVAVTDAQTITGVYDAIHLLGALTGQNDGADALVQSMAATFAAVTTEADFDEDTTVYFEVSPLEYGLWTAGGGTFMDELCTALGVRNAFADVEGWAQISEEQVLERDPDYIITTAMYFGEGATPVEEITGRAGWQSLTAVQNGRVFQADSDCVTRPGPRLADGLSQLAEFLAK